MLYWSIQEKKTTTLFQNWRNYIIIIQMCYILGWLVWKNGLWSQIHGKHSQLNHATVTWQYKLDRHREIQRCCSVQQYSILLDTWKICFSLLFISLCVFMYMKVCLQREGIFNNDQKEFCLETPISYCNKASTTKLFLLIENIAQWFSWY